jgi:hypothetical protein
VGCVTKPGNVGFGTGDVILEKTGNMVGPNTDMATLIAQDPGAVWNPVTKHVDNSCALTLSCTCANAQGNGCANGLNGIISPRIVAVGLFRPSDVLAMDGHPGHSGIDRSAIKNIAGVFLLPPGTGPNPACISSQWNLCGYLTAIPGSGSGPASGNSLNVVLALIR